MSKKKSSKGTTMTLESFQNTSWGDEMADRDVNMSHEQMSYDSYDSYDTGSGLPSGPRASRGGASQDLPRYSRAQYNDLPTGPSHREDNYGGDRRRFDREREPRERLPQAPIPDDPPFTAYVGNLSYDATRADLENFFHESKCEFNDVHVVYDRIKNRAKGYAYVEFTTRDDLMRALGLDGSTLVNRELRVNVATRKDDDGSGRSHARPSFSIGRDGFGSREQQAAPREHREFRDNNRGDFRGDNRDSRGDNFERRGGFRDRGDNERRFGNRNADREDTEVSQWRSAPRAQPVPQAQPQPQPQRPTTERRFTPRHEEPTERVSDDRFAKRHSERPRLNLKQRSAPIDDNAPKQRSSIFGDAKPVDTSKKDEEIEKRLAKTTLN